MDWLAIVNSPGGLAVLVIVALGAGAKKIWVWGWVLKQTEDDRDFWRGVAIEATAGLKEAVNLAEKRGKRK